MMTEILISIKYLTDQQTYAMEGYENIGMVGKAWLDARCPPTTLLLPLFNRTGREKTKKHTGSDKDRGIYKLPSWTKQT